MNAIGPEAWLVDISNTFTKCARLRGGRLGRVRRYPTARWTKARWLGAWRMAGSPALVVASSVVPAARASLARAVPGTHFLSGHSPFDLKLRYPSTRTLGADRLANAIAASRLYRPPIIVADLGTAATFDVIDGRGAYVGGVIAPGRSTMARALSAGTALLPEVAPHMPSRAIGKSTRGALRSGLAIGFAGSVSAIIAALRKDLAPSQTLVIATGGDAAFAHSHSFGIDRINPTLTLQGLAIVAEGISRTQKGLA